MEHLLSQVKRSCKLCHTYRRFKPEESYKNEIQTALVKLYEAYRDFYNKARMDDAYTEDQVKAVFEMKQKCLDAMNWCKTCDKEIDLVNRMLPSPVLVAKI